MDVILVMRLIGKTSGALYVNFFFPPSSSISNEPPQLPHQWTALCSCLLHRPNPSWHSHDRGILADVYLWYDPRSFDAIRLEIRCSALHHLQWRSRDPKLYLVCCNHQGDEERAYSAKEQARMRARRDFFFSFIIRECKQHIIAHSLRVAPTRTPNRGVCAALYAVICSCKLRAC